MNTKGIIFGGFGEYVSPRAWCALALAGQLFLVDRGVDGDRYGFPFAPAGATLIFCLVIDRRSERLWSTQEGLPMSDHASVSPAPVASGRPTAGDMVFLGFLVCVLIAVAVMGTFNFREGLKTEAGKAQAEVLAKWLTESKDKRVQAGFEPAACASTAADPAKPPIWADCSKALFGAGGPMGNLRNAFSGEPMSFPARCDPSSPASPGQMVLERIAATPAGSAVASVTLALAAEDPIDKALTVKITVCDKGGYPIKVAEVEF